MKNITTTETVKLSYTKETIIRGTECAPNQESEESTTPNHEPETVFPQETEKSVSSSQLPPEDPLMSRFASKIREITPKILRIATIEFARKFIDSVTNFWK